MKLLSTLFLSFIVSNAFAQNCNEREAIQNFQFAQNQTDEIEAAKLFEQAAVGFKCCKNYDNYLIAAYYAGASYLNVDSLLKSKDLLEQSLIDTRGLADSTSEVNALIFHCLGEVYYGLKEATQSIFYYQKAIEIMGSADSEELAICMFNLGNSYAMQSKYEDAIVAHRKSIKMKELLSIADSNAYYQAYTTLADIYQSFGNADSAEYYYKLSGKFVNLNDSESAAYLKYKEALKLYDEGMIASAKEQFETVKTICEVADLKHDVYVGTCLYLGMIYDDEGNTAKSQKCLHRAIEIKKAKDDTYYNVLLVLGRVQSVENEYNAMQTLNQIINESPNEELKNLARVEVAKIIAISNSDSAKVIYNQILTAVDEEKYPMIYAQAICGLADIYSEQSEFETTIAELQHAKDIVTGKNAEFEADICERIGNFYFACDSIDSAYKYYKSGYDILSKQFGNQNFKTLSAEENIAATYVATEKFRKAINIYERSLSIKSKIYGELHLQLFDLYSNYANAQYNLHKYAEAGKLYDKCLQIIENMKVADAKLDVFYNNYSLYCKAIGDYKLALHYVQYSLAIKQKNLGVDNIKYANTLNNMGTIYDRLGNFNKSAECFDHAEQIMKKVSGEFSMAISEVYLNKGNLYNRLGQNELALTYYNKALDIKKEQGTAADCKLAPIYNNVGTVYQNIEDYRLAQYFFKKSLDLTLKYEGERSPETAEAYNNLGNVQLKIAKYREAIDNYLKSNQIYSIIPSINPVLVGNTYNNLASAYMQLNQLDTAQYYYYRSVELYKKVFGEKHPYLALIYNNIGNINVKQDQFEEAIKNYSLAIEANHTNFDYKTDSLPELSGFYDQNVFVNSLLLRASAYLMSYSQTHNLTDLIYAFSHFQLCDTMVANMRHSAITKNDKLELGKIVSKCCEGALSVCYELINAELPENQIRYFQQQAFSFAEKGKSNSLLESMVGQDAMKLANIPENLQQIENQLSADVLYYEKLLADKPKNATQIHDSLLSANRRHTEFVNLLEKEFPEYHQLKYADNTVTLSELQQKLPQSTQLIMYFLGDEDLYALRITNDDFSIDIQQVFNNIGDTVRLYRNSILQTSQRAMKDFCRLSNKFCNLLFPDSIAFNIKHLVVIPDGALNQIPFESLITAEVVGSVYDYASYQFLIRRFSVAYAYSATLYYRSIVRTKQATSNGWLGLAPVFTAGKYSGVLLDSRIKKFERDFTDIEVVNNDKLEPLPSSEAEVRNIFTMFVKAGLPAKACLWGSANRLNFSSDSISNFKFIHLATHGFVNSEKPELSGVQLSYLKGDKQNGVLYSSDVYGLKLNCDLLILSACETGLGKIMKGEGIVGLSRAFIYAGSKNMLVSLWKVSDSSTSLLMINFYKQLFAKENEGLGYAELLQKAKLSLMSDKNYARPYYWAPFILIGN